jgi:ABC-type phosphate transport system permease subunit
MRGVVCASLLGLAATLAEGAPVMLAASLSGRVESW